MCKGRPTTLAGQATKRNAVIHKKYGVFERRNGDIGGDIFIFGIKIIHKWMYEVFIVIP
jgi:hypothetical protein